MLLLNRCIEFHKYSVYMYMYSISDYILIGIILGLSTENHWFSYYRVGERGASFVVNDSQSISPYFNTVMTAGICFKTGKVLNIVMAADCNNNFCLLFQKREASEKASKLSYCKIKPSWCWTTTYWRNSRIISSGSGSYCLCFRFCAHWVHVQWRMSSSGERLVASQLSDCFAICSSLVKHG